MAEHIVTSENLIVVDLRKEYGPTYVRDCPYAIVSNHSKEDLIARFGKELELFNPFIVISPKVYEALKDSHKEEEKARVAGIAHPSISIELAEAVLIDELESPPSICESEIALEIIIRDMMSLPNRQGSRMYKKYILGFSTKEIAGQEGLSMVSIRQSLRFARASMRETFAKLGFGGGEL